MSHLAFNKGTSTQDENEDSTPKTQENSDTTTYLDLVKQKETAEPGPIRIAESKDLLCINIENSLPPPADLNEEIKTDKLEKLVNQNVVKINVINPDTQRRKFTIFGVYDYVFGAPAPQNAQGHPPRFTRQLWRQEQPPPQPQQTMWTQYGPYQSGAPGHGYPPPQAYAPRYPNPTGYGGDGYGGAYGYDGLGPLLYDPQSRNNFVRLVMAILFVMLAATAGFIALVLLHPDLKHFFHVVGWIVIWPALIGIMVVNCAMMCSPCARRPPCNFVCLILGTASMSVLAAKITSHYRTEIILYAVIATAVVVFVCVILACSKFDFTSYLLYIVGIATAFGVIVMIILISMLVTRTVMKPVLIVILIVGTLIQIVMLTMQLQMVLGGKTIEISEADYALAAFLLYTSIIDIFLKLVQLLGLLDS